jgi:hypothetical protein
VAGAATAAVLVGGSAVLVERADAARQDEAALQVARAFATGASQGDVAGVPGADPAAYDIVVDGLGAQPTVDVREVRRNGGSATAQLAWRWPLGPQGWTYRTTLPLTRAGEQWQVQLAPSSVHPDLADGQVLVAERTRPQRAEVLDRTGAPLVTPTPVVEVGVQPSRSTDPAALSRTLGELLDVDAAALQERITAAAPDAFVPVVVLRRSDYQPLRDRLQPLPGTVFREASLPLAPTRAFGPGAAGHSRPGDRRAGAGQRRTAGCGRRGRAVRCPAALRRAAGRRSGGHRVPAGGRRALGAVHQRAGRRAAGAGEP